ncbi:O-phosphoseryl-tRNA(Sec) selenium transferase [Ectocarpus siliculosus]|uniref:O-phosphoseryl-tRNA(Sec) selenium transferase n=1 Tax=Ectocarpus siliculosus TaxID=2880 RepID=D7G571_ECTSI|nr:O-phosphoseryl-tRNA(Sec) selenium transferase [Ectocarpus siliculosus]|eukprot:CBJ27225.1 O-phosphoseryl-tRNA(Sec) selenium transferase [Ectocarpus siliculosus]
MNGRSLEQARNLVKTSYINQGEQALNGRRKQVTALLSNRRLPTRGWDDAQIEYLLTEISLMDSNNFSENVGVGEREGRVYSGLVARRNFRLSHGVGRSGDIAEVQPKAAGSSLLAKLTHALAKDALRLAGLGNARACLVLPMATGMSLALTFAALRAAKPAAKTIVWPRMDQKSCLKAIVAAGFTPIVVENLIQGDAVATDVDGVRAAVESCGAENVLCVVTTTSCFAPRLPDKVDEVARICAASGVGHVINNAYGVQCSKTCRLVNRAMAVGRVDAVVQSTDKNFLVPVGGAVVCGPDATFIEQVGKSYAGRASSGPCLDLFITLLSMGQEGWRRLLAERETLVEPFRRRLREVAESNGERLLESSGNTISFAVTLDSLVRKQSTAACALESNGVTGTASGAPASAAFFGSMLFTRCVSGTRVVPREQHKCVGGIDFNGYGASVTGYPHDYLTAACAAGLSTEELDEFLIRLDKALRKAKAERAEALAAPRSQDGKTEAGVTNSTANGSANAEPSLVGVAAAQDDGKERAANGEVRRDTPGATSTGGGAEQGAECLEARGDDEDWDDVD